MRPSQAVAGPRSQAAPAVCAREPQKGLVLAELAGSAQYGGGERYLQLLLERIDPGRFTSLLICPEVGPFVATMQGRMATHVVPLAPLVNPRALVSLVRLLRRERVTILQTHGARSTFYGAVAGRLAGVPVIVATIHNSLLAYEVGPWRRRAYLAMQRWAMPLADRIICVSDALREYMIAEGGAKAERTVTVHNGIDLRAFDRAVKGAAVRAFYQADAGPLVVAVGRLTLQKGHTYLIEALPDLVAEWPSLRCLIVGDGELRTSLAGLAESLGMGRHCIFGGAWDAVPEVLAAADLVVLPSLSEGFPFVALEALAMMRPVIATRIPGVMEVIRDHETGLLVPVRDPSALADAMRELLRDPAKAHDLACRGRSLVEQRFTVQRMVDQTIGVIESALRERGYGVEKTAGVGA